MRVAIDRPVAGSNKSAVKTHRSAAFSTTTNHWSAGLHNRGPNQRW